MFRRNKTRNNRNNRNNRPNRTPNRPIRRWVNNNTPNRYGGAGLIILSNDCKHVLLVKGIQHGKWSFPKGHREDYDKDDLATATREVGEETGLTDNDFQIIPDPFTIIKGPKSYIFRYAVLKRDIEEVTVDLQTTEATEYQWAYIGDLMMGNEIYYDGNKYLKDWVDELKMGDETKPLVNIFNLICPRYF